MSDKYIIRNCPAFVQSSYKNRDWAIENACELIDDRCCIKQNCVLKQIVKITKNYTKGCGKHCDINRKENNCGKTCNAYKIRQILELLEIEEIK